MAINDYKPSSKKGEITLYGEDGGQIILEAVMLPRVKSVDRKIFYKADKACLVGYDLENNTHFIRADIPSESFTTNFLVSDVNGQTWLFDHANNSLQAYILNGPHLSLKWSCKNPSKEDLSHFNMTALSVDKKHKKLWGIPQQFELDKVCCWDIISGHLDYCETLYLGPNPQIISFHPNGIPIVHPSQ